jgi:DNA-binding HxlR family transcriptional regulator
MAHSDDDSSMPGAYLVEAIQGRWTLPILVCVNSGAQRFVDLRPAIPQVSANLLSQRLRELEGVGLIEPRFLPPIARHVYMLAPGAAGLKPVLEALASWQAETDRPTN